MYDGSDVNFGTGFLSIVEGSANVCSNEITIILLNFILNKRIKFMDTEFARLTHTYLYHRNMLKAMKSKQDEAGKALKAYIDEHGEPDDRGSLVVEFEEPVTIDGVEYSGMMQQRRASEYLDTDKVEKLAIEKDLRDRMVQMEEVWDYAEIYVLYQEGLITEEEFDSLMDVSETLALVPLKA